MSAREATGKGGDGALAWTLRIAYGPERVTVARVELFGTEQQADAMALTILRAFAAWVREHGEPGYGIVVEMTVGLAA